MRGTIAFIIAAAMFVFGSTSAHALQLLCNLPSAKDGALLETLKITIGSDNTVSILHKYERGRFNPEERQENEKVLFHSMTMRESKSETDSSERLSVMVIEQRSDHNIDLTYPPKIYFVDWSRAKLAVVDVPFTRDPIAQLYFRWQCERQD